MKNRKKIYKKKVLLIFLPLLAAAVLTTGFFMLGGGKEVSGDTISDKGKVDFSLPDAANKQTLATMEEGKVNFVTKEFRGTFYGKPASQTLWPDRGKGFTVQQAAQMIQGYAVYRNDLVNFLSGEPHSAWVKFDMDKGVGANGNFNQQQYHDPQYGFNLPKVLDNYKIGELAVPEKRKKLEADLRNGLTPLVSTEKDGKPVKLLLEAIPRYGKLNFYTP